MESAGTLDKKFGGPGHLKIAVFKDNVNLYPAEFLATGKTIKVQN